MKAICDADAFCYGPVATLLTILRRLRALGWEIHVLAQGSALELASRELGLSCVETDLRSLETTRAQVLKIGRPDIVISVLGDHLVTVAQEMAIPVAYIDPLFWLWPSASENHLRNADWYFVDRGFESSPNESKLWAKIRNPIMVGPIVEDTGATSCDKDLDVLIGYGGMDAPYYRSVGNGGYATAVTKELLNALDSLELAPRYLFTAGESTTLLMQETFPAHKHLFASLPHDEFLGVLERTKLFLTVPGANSPFEAYVREVPCCYLPPSNYSQVLQLRRLRSLGLAPASVSLEELLGADKQISEKLPEQEGVDVVQTHIEEWSHDSGRRGQFEDRIASWLSQDGATFAKLAQSQRTFFQSIGGSGVAAIVETLQGLQSKCKESF